MSSSLIDDEVVVDDFEEAQQAARSRDEAAGEAEKLSEEEEEEEHKEPSKAEDSADEDADEAEEDVEEDEEEEEQSLGRRKKRKRQKADTTLLDREDLLLIVEGGGSLTAAQQKILDQREEADGSGSQAPRKLRRLKKRQGEGSSDRVPSLDVLGLDVLLDDEEQAQRAAAERERRERELAEELEEEIDDSEDEMDDFIELTAKQKEMRRARRKMKKQGRLGNRAASHQRQQVQRLFRMEDDDFEELDAGESDSDFGASQGPEEEDALGRERLELDPATMEERFLTDRDEQIRVTDIPERLQEHCPGRSRPSNAELEQEARWIQQQWEVKIGHRNVSEHTILRVLRFIHNRHYDVPFLATYRKEYFDHEFETSDLWTLLQWDERWFQLQSRRAQLRRLFRDNAVSEELIEEMQGWGMEELNDYFEQFASVKQTQLQDGHQAKSDNESEDSSDDDFASDDENDNKKKERKKRKHRKARRQDAFSRFWADGLMQCAEQFGISSEELGENIISDYQMHEPADPTQAPLELAGGYAAQVGYGTGDEAVEKALHGCRVLLARQISLLPALRQAFRHSFGADAVVSTVPTVKGRHAITGMDHQFRNVKRLLHKPLQEFQQDEFFLCVAAERQQLITMTVTVPQQVHEATHFAQLETLYCSNRTDAHASLWNEQRQQVLHLALRDYLYPAFARELIAKEAVRCEEIIIQRCRGRLFDKIRVAPFRVGDAERVVREQLAAKQDNVHELPLSHQRDPQTPARVLSINWGEADTGSYYAMLDVNGRILQKGELKYLRCRLRSRNTQQAQRKRDSLRVLRDVIASHRPDVIVLGASDPDIRELADDIRINILHGEGDGLNDPYNAYEEQNPHSYDGSGSLYIPDETVPYELSLDAQSFHNFLDAGSSSDSLDDDDEDYDDDDYGGRSRRRGKHSNKRRSKQRQDNPSRGTFSFRSIPVIFGDTSISSINGYSRLYNEEFSSESALCKETISLGRFLQDPLLEATTLCTPSSRAHNQDLLKVHLDNRQKLVDGEKLMKGLRQCFVELIASVGIELNRSLLFKHFSQALQFVPGLGSRKATGLLKSVHQKVIHQRDDLKAFVGETVFKNMAGFVRITPAHLGDPEMWYGFDYTRIHPEDYSVARKMVADALEVPVETVPKHLERAFLYRQGNFDKLDALDMQTFAISYEKRFNRKIVRTLDLMKTELQTIPFQDRTRIPWQPPSENTLYQWWSGVTDSNFHRGMLVPVRVIGFQRDRVVVRVLDTNLRGHVVKEELTDDHQQYDDVNEIVHVGDQLRARVYSVIKRDFLAVLSTRGTELADEQGHWQKAFEDYHIRDRYLQNEPAESSAAASSNSSSATTNQLAAKEKERTRKEQRDQWKKRDEALRSRVIPHPDFKPMTFIEVEEFLETQPINEVVIRPSSRGFDHITITWKFHDKIIIHIDVLELDKPNPAALGRTLKIGNEKFEDLDDILSNYLQPIGFYCDKMRQCSHFTNKEKDQVDEYLKKEKSRTPSRIPYAISPSFQRHGRFLLSYLPKTKPFHEYIWVTARGFTFRTHRFTDPDELIAWFKKNWRDQTHLRKKPVAAPSSSSSSSSTSAIPAAAVSSSSTYARSGSQYPPARQDPPPARHPVPPPRYAAAPPARAPAPYQQPPMPYHPQAPPPAYYPPQQQHPPPHVIPPQHPHHHPPYPPSSQRPMPQQHPFPQY